MPKPLSIAPEIIAALRGALTDLTAARQVELVDMVVRPSGRGVAIDVILDKPGGIGLDECASVHRAFVCCIDEGPLLTQAYAVQVSSPGLDRPLRSERDYQRAIGSLVKIIRRDGQPALTCGVLRSVADGVIRLELETGVEQCVAIADVVKANCDVRW